MATDIEVKQEITGLLSGNPEWAEIQKELDFFASTENVDGKTLLQKVYSQLKSGKKGYKNPFHSKLLYALGITTKKPDKEFDFPKRRFFARPSPPDIDSDFDYERRDEIINNCLIAKYGRDKVANVGTYGSLKMRSALTRIIKALDIADAFHKGPQAFTTENMAKVDEILGTIPKQRGAVLKVKDKVGEEITIKTTKDLISTDSDECNDFRFYMEKFPEIYKHALNIEGLLSIFGCHASGVALSNVPFDVIAPLRTTKVNEDVVSLATQWSYEDLEFLGLVKFDILAISTLTVISQTMKLIKENLDIDIDIENLPLDDQKTLALYRSGQLVGVFQCESDGMQKTCKDIGVDRFDDIVAAIALYRPGPMESIPDYCAIKKGEKPVSYFHPSIEKYVKHILKDTYGIAIFQEQIMRICESLGGMSVSNGLKIIKGISKKDEDTIRKGKKDFIAGAIRNGIPADVIEKYWDKFIMPYSLYGFNLSHSLAYAYNSYITAYLKANYPEEFISAYLNVETSRRKLDRVLELEREAKKMGINILTRDINQCTLRYEIVRKKDPNAGIINSEIRPSIHCKGLSELAAASIVANRPYASIRELAEKTDTAVVDAESIQALCDARFFKTKPDKLIQEFTLIREDLKQNRKKGRESRNMFDEME